MMITGVLDEYTREDWCLLAQTFRKAPHHPLLRVENILVFCEKESSTQSRLALGSYRRPTLRWRRMMCSIVGHLYARTAISFSTSIIDEYTYLRVDYSQVNIWWSHVTLWNSGAPPPPSDSTFAVLIIKTCFLSKEWLTHHHLCTWRHDNPSG